MVAQSAAAPLVSVLVPSYLRARFLPRALVAASKLLTPLGKVASISINDNDGQLAEADLPGQIGSCG